MSSAAMPTEQHLGTQQIVGEPSLGYSVEGSDMGLDLGLGVFMVYLMIRLYCEILRIPLSLEPTGMNVFLQRHHWMI